MLSRKHVEHKDTGKDVRDNVRKLYTTFIKGQKEAEEAIPEDLMAKLLHAVIRATHGRAYDDRAMSSFVRNVYVSTQCPVVICPYLCTPEANCNESSDSGAPAAKKARRSK